MQHSLLSIEEVAEYLHIAVPDIERLLADGEIPVVRQGPTRVAFLKRDVDTWAARRILSFSSGDLHEYHRVSSAKVHDLSAQHAIMPEVFDLSHIDEAMSSRTMSSIVRGMVALADSTGKVVYPDDLRESLIAREKMGTTALSGGFALLHPLHHEPYMFDDSFIVLGRTISALPFHSPDGQTTDLFFAVCCQDDRIHLHLLARLCMMCQRTSLILELREAFDVAEMYDLLLQSEAEVIAKL